MGNWPKSQLLMESTIQRGSGNYSYADGGIRKANGKNKYEAVANKICFDTNIAENDNHGGVSD